MYLIHCVFSIRSLRFGTWWECCFCCCYTFFQSFCIVCTKQMLCSSINSVHFCDCINFDCAFFLSSLLNHCRSIHDCCCFFGVVLNCYLTIWRFSLFHYMWCNCVLDSLLFFFDCCSLQHKHIDLLFLIWAQDLNSEIKCVVRCTEQNVSSST